MLQAIKTCTTTLRELYTTPYNYNQAKMMKKVLGGGMSKRKSKYFDTSSSPLPKSFGGTDHKEHKPINPKRATVLNKLFMRYITDLMATGECSSQFIGHQIEINRVQVSPDCKCINVYWITQTVDNDDAVDKILQNNAGQLRHELAQLKLVGVIPRIQFLKDKKYAQLMKIDQLLAQADYGEDYTPIDLNWRLKAQLELNTNLKPEVVEKIRLLEETDEEAYEEPLPMMPNNVFGLNHSEIMERVLKTKTKSLALHRLLAKDDDTPATSINKNPIYFKNSQEEREAFREFLQKRQIMKDKMEKVYKNYSPDAEYLHEQWLQKQKEYYENVSLGGDEEQDYIDDEPEK